MILPIIFFVSGACIILLLLMKVLEMKTRRTPVLLRIISLGDARMKALSHRSAHFYADSKEDVKFFWQKQLPLHTKNTWHKVEAMLADKAQLLTNDLRGTKLFKKRGDISDYFKSMSEEENKPDETREAADSQNSGNTVE